MPQSPFGFFLFVALNPSGSPVQNAAVEVRRQGAVIQSRVDANNINIDDSGAIVPFEPDHEKLIRALASQAAVAIRNARLEDLSFRDSLTELYNRRYFALRIDEEVKRHTRFGHPLSLVVLNIDRFKQFNADRGPALSDEVLREVARRRIEWILRSGWRVPPETAAFWNALASA